MKEIEWDAVEVVGEGANRIFKCSGKRNEKINRKELQNYSKSGNRKPVIYEKALEDLLMLHLTYDNKKYPTISSKNLLRNMGAITNEMYELSCLKNAPQKKEFFQKLKERKSFAKIEESLFLDVVSRETNRLEDSVVRVLIRLHEIGILEYERVTMGIKEMGGWETSHEKLDSATANKINLKQVELMDKHQVHFNDVKFRMKYENVKAYKKEEWEYLLDLGYQRIYSTNSIILKKPVVLGGNYRDKRKELIETLRLQQTEYAINRAEKRNETYLTKPVKSKSNLFLLTLVGGKKKKDALNLHAQPQSSEVYGTHLLEYDYMTQIKFSGIYGREYGEMLKLLYGLNKA
ncbi:hypothetical protein ACWNS2_10140 [Planococcus plakortidis]